MTSNNEPQHREDYPLYKTVEEIMEHARATIPPNKILLQKAGGDGVSFQEFLNNVNRVCNMLLEFGIEKNHHVGIFLSNCIEYAYLYAALGLLGVPVVPVNPFLKGDSLSYILDHCDIEYLITNKKLFSEKVLPVRPCLNKIKGLLYLGDEIQADGFEKVLSLSNYVHYSAGFEKPWEVSGSDVAVIWLTSGTTGLPKAVETTHEYLFHRVSFSANYYRMAPSDVIYFVLPMYHIPFYVSALFSALASGCSIVSVDWFSASKFWEHVVEYRATVMYSTGTIMAILLKLDVGDFERHGRELLRLWQPWPLDQPDVARARWPKTRFMEGYGLTEYALAAMSSFESPEVGCQGRATPYTDLKICDPETGSELAAGKVGEIVVRSKIGPAYMMRGYYKAPLDTAVATRDGWFHTGDAGYLDEKDLLHFVDRLKDSVRVGGENVPSVEVEAIIRRHPKIDQVAVVGVEGELGPEIIAHVVLKHGEILSPEEFFDFCSDKMAYFMVPKHLCIKTELPKTATMRVQKFKLREEGLTSSCFTRRTIEKRA
jgi:crotonobetaine/carnitine-CoA ligase